MNRAKTTRSEQENAKIDSGVRIEEEIEAILSGKEELIPSLGFVASVMEQVRQQAALPPPIPFPWKRAVAGILLSGGVLGWGAFEIVRLSLPAFRLPVLNALALLPHKLPAAVELPAALIGPADQAGWVALGLGASLLSWLLSRRLAGRGGLL